MTTVTLNIQGMTCGGCAANVERTLKALAGVQQAKVDLAAARATVDYDAAQATPAAMVSAVEDAGFDAAVAG